MRGSILSAQAQNNIVNNPTVVNEFISQRSMLYMGPVRPPAPIGSAPVRPPAPVGSAPVRPPAPIVHVDPAPVRPPAPMVHVDPAPVRPPAPMVHVGPDPMAPVVQIPPPSAAEVMRAARI